MKKPRGDAAGGRPARSKERIILRLVARRSGGTIWALAQDAGGAVTHDSPAAFRTTRIPIRAPAVAATGGRRRNWPRSRRATALRPSGPAREGGRVACSSLAHVTTPRTARMNQGCGCPPRGAHPHPRVGGRRDGRRAAGGGTGRWHQDARGALGHPTGPGRYRSAHPRHGRSGYASACR